MARRRLVSVTLVHARAWCGRVLVLVSALATVGPSLAAQAVHPRLTKGEKAIRSLLVLPPRIEIARGSDEVNAMNRESWATTLGGTARAAIEESGWEVTREPGEGPPKDSPEFAAVEALQQRWDGLLPKVSAHPKDVAKGSFSLGPAVQRLGAARADALVLVRASLSSKSKIGETTVTETSLSFSISYEYDVKSSYAFVDAQTGDVLYFFTARGKGDRARAEQEVKQAVVAAMRKLPR